MAAIDLAKEQMRFVCQAAPPRAHSRERTAPSSGVGDDDGDGSDDGGTGMERCCRRGEQEGTGRRRGPPEGSGKYCRRLSIVTGAAVSCGGLRMGLRLPEVRGGR